MMAVVDYDAVLDKVGQFGIFQKKVLSLLSLVSAGGGLAIVVFVFTGFEQNYRCRVPQCEYGPSVTYYKETPCNQSSCGSGYELPSWYGEKVIAREDRCRNLEVRDGDCRGENTTWLENTAEHFNCGPEDLVFDRTLMYSTLIEEFQLVCEKSSSRVIVNVTYMIGCVVGCYLFGWISDTFGRIKALILGILLVSLAGSGGALCSGAGGVYAFAATRFICGIGAMATFMVSFVLIVEHVGFKYSYMAGLLIDIPFALGEVLLGVEAYFIRDWRTLQIVAYLPMLLLLLIFWTVPESVRWLLAKGEIKKAKQIVEKIAKTNGQPISDHIFPNLNNKNVSDLTNFKIWDILRSKTLTLRILNMSLQWFSITMCYYGLSFASTSLSRDIFMNFLLSVAIEIPAYILCLFMINYCGRRPVLSFCQIFSGLACMCSAILMEYETPALDTLRLLCSLVGKFGEAAASGLVYLYTAELFPTVMRNRAVGFCAFVGKLGGITTMVLELLKDFWLPAPVMIMGVSATLAGICALSFPETAGEKLPDTIEEATKIGVNDKRSICECAKGSILES